MFGLENDVGKKTESAKASVNEVVGGDRCDGDAVVLDRGRPVSSAATSPAY